MQSPIRVSGATPRTVFVNLPIPGLPRVNEDGLDGDAAPLVRQALLLIAAACFTALGTVFAGLAAMLWAVLPPSAIQSGWALVAIPAAPLGLGAWCLVAYRRRRRALRASIPTRWKTIP